ncbi:MAG TPA: 4-(cytidine 5'-diphospho)-2-C-methyl-D-erythritol kinase [Solirubrobacteraceae bacterium]|nr:4-(cytidine 5'-diphospho)-2-C-methyl-D-erythritol kinase [Solirubrobacteraceae bacterium]
MLRALAPAKINLGLFVGPLRDDGRHELVSVMQSISLADELTLEPAPGGGDEVLCPGVPGAAEDNLAARALALFRARSGWDGPPVRLSVVKRIPLAAGLAGGSADAAAALRLAAQASGVREEALLAQIAAELGADVPAQVAPGRWLATGAGERLQPLPPPRAALGVLVAPVAAELSTAAVYAQADRLGELRSAAELKRLRGELAAALAGGEQLPADALLVNDLQRAALQLCPQVAEVLEQVRAAGAAHALVSGSGPTVLGLFAGADGVAAAERAALRLGARTPAAICAAGVDAAFGQVTQLAASA